MLTIVKYYNAKNLCSLYLKFRLWGGGGGGGGYGGIQSWIGQKDFVTNVIQVQ